MGVQAGQVTDLSLTDINDVLGPVQSASCMWGYLNTYGGSPSSKVWVPLIHAIPIIRCGGTHRISVALEAFVFITRLPWTRTMVEKVSYFMYQFKAASVTFTRIRIKKASATAHLSHLRGIDGVLGLA